MDTKPGGEFIGAMPKILGVWFRAAQPPRYRLQLSYLAFLNVADLDARSSNHMHYATWGGGHATQWQDVMGRRV